MLCTSALHAQTAPPAPAAAAPQPAPQEGGCELHIWSAPNYMTDIHGIGGGLLGAVTSAGSNAALRPNGQAVIESWLTPEFITTTARSLDLAAAMGGPVSVILHPTTRREVNGIMRRPARATTSAAGCYHELYVRTIFLQRSTMLGTRFFVSWRLKTFAPGAASPRVVTSSDMMQLPGFRVERPQAEIRADLEDALKRSLETFMSGALNGSIS